MSWDAIIAVMDGSHARGASFACLLAIAKSATEDGGWKAYMSVEEVADRARIEPRSARRAIRKAEAIGELHTNIMHGRQGVNLYRLETGMLMRQAMERFPDRRYGLDGTGYTPDRESGGRTVGPGTPDRRSATPDRRSATPDRRSPGEGSRGIREGEGEGARTSGRRDAAEPPTQKEVEPAQSVRSAVQGGSPAGRVCPKGEPQANPWDEADGDSPGWERFCKQVGVQAHNGQAKEWAEILTDIGVITDIEAGEALRLFCKFGKKEQPDRRKPWAVSELIGFKEDVAKTIAERRAIRSTLKATP